MSLNELKDYLIDSLIWAREVQENLSKDTPLGDVWTALQIEVGIGLLIMLALLICWAPFGLLYLAYDNWKWDQARKNAAAARRVQPTL